MEKNEEKRLIEYVKAMSKKKREFKKMFKDNGYPDANVLVDLSTNLLFIDLDGTTDLDDYEAFFKAQLKATALMRVIEDNKGIAESLNQIVEEKFENKDIPLENLANPKYNDKNKA